MGRGHTAEGQGLSSGCLARHSPGVYRSGQVQRFLGVVVAPIRIRDPCVQELAAQQFEGRCPVQRDVVEGIGQHLERPDRGRS